MPHDFDLAEKLVLHINKQFLTFLRNNYYFWLFFFTMISGQNHFTLCSHHHHHKKIAKLLSIQKLKTCSSYMQCLYCIFSNCTQWKTNYINTKKHGQAENTFKKTQFAMMFGVW